MDTLMPTFDPEIRRVADRLLVQPRKVASGTSSAVNHESAVITPQYDKIIISV